MFLHKVFLQKFNVLSDVTVRVHSNANGVLMQSTLCRLCLDLIHHGRFMLKDFSNKYVMGKIDMCAVVDLIKYHQINNVDQESLKMEENVFTIVRQMIQHFAELILKRPLLMKLLRVFVSKIKCVLELQQLA